MPKETVAEMFHFIADTESFKDTLDVLGGAVDIAAIQFALREVGARLREEALQEAKAQDAFDPKENKHLSDQSKEVLAALTPSEEKKLIQSFGFEQA